MSPDPPCTSQGAGLRNIVWIAAASTMLGALLGAASTHGADLPGEVFTELLGLRLHRVNLPDVQERLGHAEVKETGDAGEYLATVCYSDLSADTVVVFKSGEMGGPHHAILGFELRRQSEADPECPPLAPRVIGTHGLRIGPLQLGMSREAFTRALGELVPLPGRGVGRVFSRRDPMTGDDLARCPQCKDYPYWDVVIVVGGEFREGVLVRVNVWKTVTS